MANQIMIILINLFPAVVDSMYYLHIQVNAEVSYLNQKTIYNFKEHKWL